MSTEERKEKIIFVCCPRRFLDCWGKRVKPSLRKLCCLDLVPHWQRPASYLACHISPRHLGEGHHPSGSTVE
ncbi:hypothetical protein HHX47_DHR1001073 [Lentinula edodes]|nr:hypothetical protein HHX47_DHR1001073 [Lentinula edodes]